MNKETIRFTLSITPDIAQKAEAFKKDTFYDKPYSEMYRQLIQLGMEKLEEKAAKGSKRERSA